MVTCWGQWTISFVLGGWYRHNTFLKMFPSSANGLSYCTRINKPGPRFAFKNTMTVYMCKPIACFFKSESVIGDKLMMNSSQSDCIYDTLALFSWRSGQAQLVDVGSKENTLTCLYLYMHYFLVNTFMTNQDCFFKHIVKILPSIYEKDYRCYYIRIN